MQELGQVSVVGAGRMGSALAAALRAAGAEVEGPLRRGERPHGEVVLLCVPDRSIAEAAAAIPPGPAVGHTSGATTLEPLGAHRAFSLHPLMTVPYGAQADFGEVPCAVAGDPVATTIAHRLGMRPIVVSDQDRPAYHAAAVIASNFLVVLEEAAARVAATAGLDRADLLPLVRASVENWARLGPEALTGPIGRGDVATISRHREALRARTPELLALYDTMLEVAGR